MEFTIEGTSFDANGVIAHKTLEAWLKWASERCYEDRNPAKKEKYLTLAFEKACKMTGYVVPIGAKTKTTESGHPGRGGKGVQQ